MRLQLSLCSLVCLCAVASATNAAEVKRLGECHLMISGELDKTTPAQVQTALKGCAFDKPTFVIFDSPGGEVQSAIEVGRILRKQRAWTKVTLRNRSTPGSCTSACILAFIDGVNRSVDWGKIGLHRAYPALTSSTSEEVRANREKIDRLIREYLASMNIQERLLFEMNAVSPGSIRWLDEEELRQLQITGIDPVYADERDARYARQLGISMHELYARRQKVPSICGSVTPTEQGMEEYTKCFERVMQGTQ